MEDFEKHLEELDKIAEGFLSSIGQAIKGLGKGVTGEPYSEEDYDKENPKINKDLGGYLGSGQASDAMTGSINKQQKQKAGIKSGFQIGNNKIENVSEDLRVILFKLDASGNYNLIYDFESDIYEIRWLLDGNYEAQELGLSSTNTGGSIKGRDITFKGVWKGGDFKGTMLSPSSIIGGIINGGEYFSNPEGFKIPPYNFIEGGYFVSKGFIMGYPIAEENKSYEKLSLIQLKEGQQIKIVDNNDVEHLLTIYKGINSKSLDFNINEVDVSWENYNRNKLKFDKTIMEIGKTFSIPGVIDIPAGIQSIEVKASSYIKKEPKVSKASKEKEEKESGTYKFVIKKQKGWGNPAGYRLDKFATEDEIVREKIDKFKSDIESGAFFKYLNFFKKLITQGRVDGYGNFPTLSYLFPKQIGTKHKQQDPKRDSTMKYFSDFSENVIDNLSSESISKFYENKIKKELGLSAPETNVPTNKSISKAGKKRTISGQPIRESKLSMKAIVEDLIKNK